MYSRPSLKVDINEPSFCKLHVRHEFMDYPSTIPVGA